MGVRILAGDRRARFPESASILVEDSGVRILVDAGSPEAAALASEVDAVVYTHHHPDHIRASHIVDAARHFSPAGEAAYPSMLALARRFAPGVWREWLSMAQTLIGMLSVPSDAYYEPGEDLCIRGLCLKTAPAPGHLLTHTLVELPGRILHIGDIDLTGFGPWYGNPESDPLQFLADIELAASWDARAYTTSHRVEVIPRAEAIPLISRFASRLADHFEAVLNAYKARGEPARPADLAGKGVIYPRIPPHGRRVYLWFESMMVQKLTSALAAHGCLRRTRHGYEVLHQGSCRLVERIHERAEGLLAYL